MARVAFYGLVLGMVAVFLFPVYYTLVASFASDQGQFQVVYWPESLNLNNFALFLGQRGFVMALLNSVIVAVVAVGAALTLAVMAAYALGRVRFAGRGLLMGCILAVSMFPQVAILAGMFEMARFLNLYNTIWALVVAQTAFTLPFTVWLLTVFMRDLPIEIEEAAVIDGATPWILVTQIFLPLLAPALVTTGLLAFIGSWNEFLFALTLTLSEDQRTVPVVMTMISPMAWPQTAAASMIVTAPMVGLVLVFQRRIVSGLTAGARVG
jgi:trehalose/maltose transport system permease protein